MLLTKAFKRFVLLFLDKLVLTYFQRTRIRVYKVLSNNLNITGNPLLIQPLLLKGNGKISFGKNVQIGCNPSPFLYNGYMYIEARNTSSIIKIGDGVFFNNNLVLICDKSSITIGNNVLIGTNVEIIDSDFHNILPGKRLGTDYVCKEVRIEENVFIGSNVKIMKGVIIGKNSVIANSSVVVKSIPENVIAAGNPAKVIKSVYE